MICSGNNPYDTFVSYWNCDEDRKFVHHTLLPKLEKEMKHKLCLRERDLINGEREFINLEGSTFFVNTEKAFCK